MKSETSDNLNPFGDFSPSAYMRQRRPHLFSDTHTDNEPALSKEVFTHHLSTITSRNGEASFEHFGRKLIEAEICPNLLPNTGPSGGGDSKTDTETYPVSAEVALRWYQGEQAAANERWAFAISAKKQWTGKVRHDVACTTHGNPLALPAGQLRRPAVKQVCQTEHRAASVTRALIVAAGSPD